MLAKMTFRGVEIDVDIHYYQMLTGKEVYHFYVFLTFPNNDWDRLMTVNFNWHSYESGYKTFVGLNLEANYPSPKAIKKPTEKEWKIETEAYKYVLAGGMYECNKESATSIRYKKSHFKERLVQAFVKLLQDQPDLLPQTVVESYEASHKHEEEEIVKLEKRIAREKEGLLKKEDQKAAFLKALEG